MEISRSEGDVEEVEQGMVVVVGVWEGGSERECSEYMSAGLDTF